MPSTTVKQLVCAAGTVKGGSRMTQKHKTHDADRLLVGAQHNLLSGLGVCKRNVTSALAPSKLEVKPLLKVPGLVRHLQADGRRDDIDRAMTHEKPVTQ